MQDGVGSLTLLRSGLCQEEKALRQSSARAGSGVSDAHAEGVRGRGVCRVTTDDFED